MEPAKLTKLVRGELDWIVMKCLEKDRDRRYETANGFAADVQRYLNDEPVQACPPSARYRLRKLYRRNRGMVIAASVILLSLITGIIGTTGGLIRAEAARQEAVQAQRAEAERAEGERQAKQQALASAAAEKQAKDTAVAREAQTRAVLDFVENKVFAAARPKGQDGGLGHDVPLRRAIEAALPFVEKSFKDQPLIEALLRMTLGISFAHLGEAKIAAEQFERARMLRTKHLGPDDRDTLKSMNNLANSYGDLGRHAEALELYEETLARMKATLGSYHPHTLASMNNLAICYAALGRHADALKLQAETLALRKEKLGPNNPNTLASMHNLANRYAALGRHADALKLREETLALRKVWVGPIHPDTLKSMHNLASSYDALGRHAEALKLYDETLVLRKAELGPDHSDTLESMMGLAWFLATCSDPNFREPGRAVELAKKAVELAPKEGNYWNTLGAAHYRAGDWKAAVAALEKSRELRQGGDIYDWFFLAMAHGHLGEKEEARKWYDRAIAWTDKNNPNDEEVRRFREEAAKVLMIDDPSKPVPLSK
jgi:tetratricopeptide (TPR) repeat protein